MNQVVPTRVRVNTRNQVRSSDKIDDENPLSERRHLNLESPRPAGEFAMTKELLRMLSNDENGTNYQTNKTTPTNTRSIQHINAIQNKKSAHPGQAKGFDEMFTEAGFYEPDTAASNTAHESHVPLPIQARDQNPTNYDTVQFYGVNHTISANLISQPDINTSVSSDGDNIATANTQVNPGTEPTNTNNTNANTNPNTQAQTFNDIISQMEMWAYRVVIRDISLWIKHYMIIVLTYLQAILIQQSVFPYIIPLITVWLFCIYKVITICWKKHSSRLTQRQRRAIYFEPFEWILLCLFLLIVTLKLTEVSVLLLPFAFLGLGTIIFGYFVYDTFHPTWKKNTIFFFKLALWIQASLISFKADRVFQKWSYAFYPSLGVSAIILLYMLARYTFIIVQILVKCRRENNFRYVLYGNIWSLLNWLIMVPCCLSFCGLIRLSEGQGSLLLVASLAAGLGHAIFMVILTIATKGSLEVFLIVPIIAAEREKINRLRSEQEFEHVRVLNAYLIQISATYFVDSDTAFKMKDKDLFNKWRQQVKNAKLRKHLTVEQIRLDEIRKVLSQDRANKD